MSSQFTSFVVPLILFVAIIYFLMIRPQQKQQKERRLLLNSIRAKDKVVTIGGLHGVITKVKEDTVLVRVAQNVEVEFSKSSIQTITNRNYKDGVVAGDKKQKKNIYANEEEKVDTEDVVDDDVLDENAPEEKK